MREGLFTFLVLFIAILHIGTLWSIYLRSRARATPMAIATVLLFTGVALDASFGVRAQVLGWACFAAFLLLLQRKDSWYYAAIAVVILWANCHASAMLAPVFLAARIAGTVADRGMGSLRVNRDIRILPFVALALLCTPLGWHLPAYAITLMASPIRQYIQEWQPAGIAEPDFLFGALPLAILIALGGFQTLMKDKAESVPVAMLFFAVLSARRNEPLFAIAAAPLAAQCLDLRFPSLRRIADRVAGLERFAIVATCFAFGITALAFTWANHDAAPKVPVVALGRLAAGGREHRLFCENFNDCSVALQYPNVRVFMDGRCDPFPLAVWKAYISVVRLQPGWKRTLADFSVDSIVAARKGGLAAALDSDTSWRTEFRDDTFVVYVRT
jgi:hypothetical protein